MKTLLQFLVFVAFAAVGNAQFTGLYVTSSSGRLVGQGLSDFIPGVVFGNSEDGRLKVGLGEYSELLDAILAHWGVTVDFASVTPVIGQAYAVTDFQTSLFDSVGQPKPALNIERLQFDRWGLPERWVSPDFVTGSYKVIAYEVDDQGNLLSGAIDVLQYEGSTPQFTFASWRMNSDIPFTASTIPEPSTYAMIAGLGILGFVVWKRRKPFSTSSVSVG